jgi:hypothetical protein
LQRISTSRYNSNSRTTQAAITVIAACRAPLPHTFAADSTLTGHYKKVPLNAEITFLLLKERRPFKFKKKMSIGTMANHKLLIDTTFDPC